MNSQEDVYCWRATFWHGMALNILAAILTVTWRIYLIIYIFCSKLQNLIKLSCEIHSIPLTATLPSSTRISEWKQCYDFKINKIRSRVDQWLKDVSNFGWNAFFIWANVSLLFFMLHMLVFVFFFFSLPSQPEIVRHFPKNSILSSAKIVTFAEIHIINDTFEFGIQK